MVRNIFLYIFIYVILIGCESNPVSVCESNCYLDVQASSLTMGENGIYELEWLDGYTQTFTTLDAETGSDTYTRVHWDTDLGMWYQGEVIKPINHSSYTDEEDGIAHTVLGPWEVMINKTITIYTTYTDECGIDYLDSIKVKVVNEIQE
jgi:hypothetical protein